jgi:hypothetical protein
MRRYLYVSLSVTCRVMWNQKHRLIHTFCAIMETGNKYSHSQRRTLLILSNSGPLTSLQIAEKFPACKRTIQRALNALHSAHAVFIQDYKQDLRGGLPSKVWSAGLGNDATPPPRRTSAERARSLRRRMTPEERDFARARARALARKPRRDRLTMALFGSPVRVAPQPLEN